MSDQFRGQRSNLLGLIFSFVLLLGPSLSLGQIENDKPDADPKFDIPAAINELKLNQKQADAIQIQMDANGPVFTFDVVGGGLVAPVEGQAKDPKLQVFADGRIVLGGNLGVPNMESKFTAQELVEFLDFVVNKNDFYQLDSDDLKKRMDGKGGTLADASSSVFTIDLQKGKKEVKVYALWNAVKNFPDFPEIQQLSAIEHRCNAVISKIHLGDDGDAVLVLVNEKLKQLDLGLEPFTFKEMRLASRLANGRFQVSFQRTLPSADGKPAKVPKLLHAIYFVKDNETEPKVSFYGLPKKE